jgi:4-aminobutyrate--pyruvate transaminase
MGAGGVILPPKGYFDAIGRVLAKHDIPLIDDEVICGFGRTGAMWGSTTYGIQPGIVTCAKGLSSGYLPIGAVMVSEEVYAALARQSEKIGVFGHGFTYSGHPVTSAVALETLKIYEETDLLAHVQKIAPRLQTGLRQFADHPLVGEVRGVGLIGAVELVADKATKQPCDPKLAVGGFLAKRAHHHGLIIRALGDSIAFCPPLIIQEDEIDLLLERFGLALADTLTMLREHQ